MQPFIYMLKSDIKAILMVFTEISPQTVNDPAIVTVLVHYPMH